MSALPGQLQTLLVCLQHIYTVRIFVPTYIFWGLCVTKEQLFILTFVIHDFACDQIKW